MSATSDLLASPTALRELADQIEAAAEAGAAPRVARLERKAQADARDKLRLQDLVAELRRQMRSMERQLDRCTCRTSPWARPQWDDRRMTVLQAPGARHALAFNPDTSDRFGPSIIFAVGDPKGHPFDVGPLAVLDLGRIRDLHRLTGEVLAEHDGPRHKSAHGRSLET